TTLKTPALADSSEPAVSERQSSDAADSDAETPRPGTATRLPGISETDLPRIRQRMYRIDI
ncbi:MAG: hypothetical protein KJO82_11485, partial [Gammaproteobacteria bacterium]|nr:hypothetical protein [Gammaproteobacteria bacterium]